MIGKNKRGGHFRAALTVILLSMTISILAFISEDDKITGFAVIEPSYIIAQPSLIEFGNVDALGSLAPGNYFIDEDGIVYWLDDSSKPAIAKVYQIDEIEKNRKIYIDNNGNIGYLLP
jgi:hypothetical protein